MMKKAKKEEKGQKWITLDPWPPVRINRKIVVSKIETQNKNTV